MTWRDDKEDTDPYLAHVVAILAKRYITVAPEAEDQMHNSDLMVLQGAAANERIGVRIRTFDYLSKYPDEFTIRSSRPDPDWPTELQKIADGWGDVIVYGFRHPTHPRMLAAWLVGDLDVFRQWRIEQRDSTWSEPGQLLSNRDGSSEFRAYTISDLPPEFILERREYRQAHREAA